MSYESLGLLKQLVELTVAVGELKTRAEVAEVKLAAAEERIRMLFETKNMWMERALLAEKKGEVEKKGETK